MTKEGAMATLVRYCILISLAMLAACQPSGQGSSPPRIIAQGFEIAIPREGKAGEFGRIGIRIQIPGKLQSLSIRAPDRQLELAHGASREQLQWFGLEASPASRQDLALDLSPYVNLWTRQPGEYLFAVKVQDQDGQKAEASLQIVVL